MPIAPVQEKVALACVTYVPEMQSESRVRQVLVSASGRFQAIDHKVVPETKHPVQHFQQNQLQNALGLC